MGEAVKRTISLPSDLAREVEEIAREEGKSVSAVIQEALRIARRHRMRNEFSQIQGFWSKKAKAKGILTDRDLKRYLEQ
jgi:metal-responsive CopG/Arc/MetJ family transcriptional regulator